MTGVQTCALPICRRNAGTVRNAGPGRSRRRKLVYPLPEMALRTDYPPVRGRRIKNMDWFVYLSKLLPTLVYPIGLTFVLLAAALFAFKSEKWRLRFLIAAFLILWVTGLPFPGAWLTRSLETTVPPLPADETAAVAVVLGGGTESFEAPRQMVEIGGAGDRILYAAKLYHEGRAGKLLFGGAYFAGW